MRTKGGTPFRGKDKKLKEREDEREWEREQQGQLFVGMEDRRMRSEAGP